MLFLNIIDNNQLNIRQAIKQYLLNIVNLVNRSFFKAMEKLIKTFN